jgi:photosystem II stability/assembly factor-like uncharacterized protein
MSMVRLPIVRISLISLAAMLSLVGAIFLAQRPGEDAVSAAEAGRVKTVFLLLFENTSWSDISGNLISAPYINGTIMPAASRAEQFYNYQVGGSPSRPSETNYVWLEGGSVSYPDITFNSNNDPSPANSTAVTDHLVSRLQLAGLSWKTYQEDISGLDCPLTAQGGASGYKPKHNPFVFFQDLTGGNNPNSQFCIDHNRPLTELANDLTNNTTASYNFITPNQCNAGHDTCAVGDRIKQADTFLSNIVPQIQQSNAYKDNGAIFITWDENTAPKTDSIGMLVLSKLAKGNGYTNTIRYDHSSTVRTMQRIFGVLPPLRWAITATDLSDLFLPGVLDFPATSLTVTGAATSTTLAQSQYLASAGPVTASVPITYVWQTTGQSPITHTGRGLTDTAVLSWTTAGSKAITVTIDNAAATLSVTKAVSVTAAAPLTPTAGSLFLPGAIVNGPIAPAPTPTPTLPVTPSVGWKSVASPPGVSFYSVSFAGNSTIWASGTAGNVMKSTDSGETFNKVDIGTSQDLHGIKFFDASSGMAVGSNGRVRWTNDGGVTWATGTTSVTTDLAAVTMVSSLTGWVSGNGGVILRTDDGGKTWTSQSSGFGGDLNGIHFVDANTGWAVGAGGIILATTNGGQTWNRQKEPGADTDTLSGVFFLDKQNGWAGGDPSPAPGGGSQSNLWRTTNGGATWARVPVPIAGPAITSIRFADSLRGWAAAEERAILKTTDGGQNWTVELPVLQPPGQHYWLYGLDVRFDGLAIAVGGNYPSTGSFTPLNGVIMKRGPGL